MPIDITIIKSPENVHTDCMSQTFSEGGGTIGRGQNSSWTLDDPERFMSSTHSEILFQNGQYYLLDLSTNGTFLNGSSEPIGNGNKITLNNGDRFSISDYEFLVSMGNGTSAESIFNNPLDTGPFFSAEFSNFNQALFSQDDPFATPIPDNNLDIFSQNSESLFSSGIGETDPIAALDRAGTGQQASFSGNILDTGVQSDQGEAINDAIVWPESFPENSAIPEDWYDENEDVKIKNPTESDINRSTPDSFEQEHQLLEQENQRLMKEIARLTHQIKSKPASASVTRNLTQADKTLIEAMGLENWNLDKKKILEISQIVGLLVRETMEGMMQVLKFRKKIKEEFRINVTTIQPIENNPLKFSANIDDAMENMFIKENNAYQKPVEAVHEGFQGIAEHQVAVLAGIQAAFRGMIERFDPELLEKRFEKYSKSGLIQIGQKGKNWEAYKKYHEELVNNLDNSFQHLFGYDFVQAYEEQMQRLAISRKVSDRKKTGI